MSAESFITEVQPPLFRIVMTDNDEKANALCEKFVTDLKGMCAGHSIPESKAYGILKAVFDNSGTSNNPAMWSVARRRLERAGLDLENFSMERETRTPYKETETPQERAEKRRKIPGNLFAGVSVGAIIAALCVIVNGGIDNGGVAFILAGIIH
ncbi:hypothetical protein FACS1894156_9050 [Bacteroidia bacterium]|nr:hypothetical protein FACS1894156_9050 [Bacteroidia bacterium]